MKILILNASPRKGGNIDQMLTIIADECKTLGATVYFENVNDFNIKPCMACMKCRSTHKCVLPEDDAQRILGLITECDALVVGAPAIGAICQVC